MHKRIKDMMNMSFRVDGLRFKTKIKRKAVTIAAAQHICEQFLSSFFFFVQQPIWWCNNSTTKNQLEHTMAHKTLDGTQAQESRDGYFCSL